MSLCPRGHVLGESDRCDVCEYVESGRSRVMVSPAGDGAAREAFPRTDAGNAELFARLYGDRLRFDHRRKRWLTWQGQWWTLDSDAEVVRLAIEAARRRYEQGASIDDLKEREAEARWSIAGESRMRIEAMLSLAKAAKPIADAGERWDADSWVLGVDNGVVDLKAGRLRMGRPDDRMTMHAAGSFYSDAECPRWEAFLQEVFGGDEELIDFIWRAVGYSLTGDTSEHCVFICHGAGANGKTTFLSTLRGVLGAYGHNMPFTTIEMQGRSSVPTDVADLAGRRLVIATETDERTRLNEARLKALSGGDTISARHLYSSYFEFKPVAKFWLAVNHKPRVEDDSYGFWRRVRLVPFLQTFKGNSADKRLDQKLRAEADGILAWAVRGCREWQERGLEAPEVVRMATDQYQQESDPTAAFLTDGCVVAAGAVASASVLYKAYRAWAEEQGLRPWEVLSSTRFGRRMGERFEKRHRDKGNVYEGVGLKAEGFGPMLKGLQSDEGANRNTTPIQSPLAKELEKPSDPSGPSGDEGRRLYALSLWGEHGSPSPVELDGSRRIVDPEKFVTKASEDRLDAFISALEAMDRGA